MEISIEITKRCLNNCMHCSSESNESETKSLDLDVIKRLLLNISQNYENVTICLSGGEPLLHPDFNKIVNEIRKYKFKIKLYTSLIVDNIFSLDIDRVDTIIVNTISMTPWIYDKITNSNNYNKLIKHLNHINIFIEDKVRNFGNVKLEAHIVPNQLNIDYLEDDVNRLIYGYRLRLVSFLRLVYQGNANKNYDELKYDNDKVINIINSIKKKYGDRIRIGHPFECNGECNAITNKLNISFDGYVYPCEAFKNNKLSYQFRKYNIKNNNLSDIVSTVEYNDILAEKCKKRHTDNCLAQELLNN